MGTLVHLSSGKGLPSTLTSNFKGAADEKVRFCSGWMNSGRSEDFSLPRRRHTSKFDMDVLLSFSILVLGEALILAGVLLSEADDGESGLGSSVVVDSSLKQFLQSLEDKRTLEVGVPVSTSHPRNFHEISGSGYPETLSTRVSVSFSAQYLFSTTPGANHGAHAEKLFLLNDSYHIARRRPR